MTIQISFQTTPRVTLQQDMSESEKVALLDWLLGEMNSIELRKWNEVTKYRDFVIGHITEDAPQVSS